MHRFLNITKNTKIFVLSPAGLVTGGVELLHQLVNMINNHGGDAYIAYYGNAKHEIPKDYQKYNLKIANDIDDKKENIIVISETIAIQALKIKYAQKVLWWLSIDNFYISLTNRLTSLEILHYQLSSKSPKKYPWKLAFIRFCKAMIRHNNTVSLKKLKKAKLEVCCYQSEYAKNFLEKHGFKNLYPMKDYINDDNFTYDFNKTTKEDIIAYNPKKGIEFTKELINADETLKWVPIINLDRKGVIKLLRSAKVYVDFGFHPGKDRLPREAAINGCCIVTGKKGSARYTDVDIPLHYKHDQHKHDIPRIIAQVHDLIDNYTERIADFQHYRDNICSEKQEFTNSVLRLFQLEK